MERYIALASETKFGIVQGKKHFFSCIFNGILWSVILKSLLAPIQRLVRSLKNNYKDHF